MENLLELEMDLKPLSNIQLADEMKRLTHRMGELSMWIEESDRRIRGLILEGPDSALQRQIDRDANRGVISLYTLSGTVKNEVDLMQSAQIEKYAVLSDLKRVEIEMDRRVEGN